MLRKYFGGAYSGLWAWIVILNVVIVGAMAATLMTLDRFEAEQQRALAHIRSDQSWADQRLQRINRLSALIGYGGIIHDFKNYVLRNDPGLRTRLETDFQETWQALDALGPYMENEAERRALEDLKLTLEEYETNIAKVTSAIERGAAIREIDTLVKVDDTAAIQALNVLRTNIEADVLGSSEKTNALQEAFTAQQNAEYVKVALVALALLLSGTIVYMAVLRIRADRERLKVQLKDQWLQAINDNTADGIITTDSAGKIMSVNRSACAVFGYGSQDELIGQSINVFVPEAFRADHDMYVSKFENRPDNKWVLMANGREIEGVRKDGSSAEVSISISKIEHDGQAYFIASIHDITARQEREKQIKAAREEAVRANRAKSEFLSSMSHELRTPLNAILGFSQMLEYNPDVQLTKEQTDCVEQIKKGGNHLLTLIDEVLDLAKIEAGRIEVSIENVPPAEILDECMVLTSAIAEKNGVSIQEESQAMRHLTVRADRTRLRQVLLNLMSNAIKYNKVNGSVTVSMFCPDDHTVRISVTDTGPGLSQEQIGELFQPFNRLEAANSEVEGTGIGLVITKRLIEMMQGRIGVESELGRGSTFWVELPVATDHYQGADVLFEDKVATRKQAPEACLLYIEDNPANLKLMEMIVERSPGLSMISAHSAELGIELARAEQPDVIFMDINLPGMNGIEALKKLASQKSTENIPVIALSALARDKDVRKGMEAGFVEYLKKPIIVSEVFDALDKAMEHTVGK